MAKRIVVGQVLTPDWLKKYSNQKRDLDRQVTQSLEQPGKGLTLDQFQLFLEHQEAFGVSNWLMPFLMRELKAHLLFFGRDFDLTQFTETLKRYGRKRVMGWLELGLEPHFLPEVLMAPAAEFLGWKVKPEKWFYQQSEEGKLLRLQADGQLVVSNPAFLLEGITVLVDTRLKPAFADGRQMYESDNLLGPIIERLRQEGKVAAYSQGPCASRFNISGNEWEQHVKSAVAEMLKLEVHQVRLERTIEANVIPQLYTHMPRKDDGTTNTWEWREEFLESRSSRLIGGGADSGGLAHVFYGDPGNLWQSRAVRPLAVL